MDGILQAKFSSTFLNENYFEFSFKFHRNIINIVSGIQ